MQLTEEQYQKIAPYLPVQRGNVQASNPQMLNAIHVTAENRCKRRDLLDRFGFWNTIYQRMIRWAKNGVLDRVFEKLKEQIGDPPETLFIDSTSVKVHPDGTGPLKKAARSPSENLMDARIHKFIWLLQMIAKQ